MDEEEKKSVFGILDAVVSADRDFYLVFQYGGDVREITKEQAEAQARELAKTPGNEHMVFVTMRAERSFRRAADENETA